MNCKYLLVLIGFLVIGSAKAQESCKADGIDFGTGVVVLDNIDDTARGDINVFENAENILRIEPGVSKPDYLTIKYDEAAKTLTISLKDEFQNVDQDSDAVANGLVDVVFPVQFVCNDLSKSIVFQLRVRDTNNKEPDFDSPDYSYELHMPFPPLELTIMVPIFVTDLDFKTSTLTFDMDETYKDQFSIEYGAIIDNSKGKKHSAVLKSSKYLTLDASINFGIKVSDGVHEKSATVQINVIPGLSSPKFSSPTYSAKYYKNEDGSSMDHLEGETISVTGGENPTDITLSFLNSEDDTYFSIKDNADRTFNVEVKANLPETIIDELIFKPVGLRATVAGAGSDATATLIIELPKIDECEQPVTTECPIVTSEPCTCPVVTTESCPECPTTTECPPVTDCPEVTSPIDGTTTECPVTPPKNVWYEHGIYQFRIVPEFVGELGLIEATITEEPEEIRYSIIDGALNQIQLDETTAALTLTAALNLIEHEITIQAEGQTTMDVTTTKVIISVNGLKPCLEGTQFQFLLYEQTITEEEENDIYNFYDFISGEPTEPTITITTKPEAYKDHFYIDVETKMLKSTADIDREAADISETSQILLELEIVSEEKLNIYDPANWKDLSTNNILNNGKLMRLVLHVEDINDNNPKFDANEIVVGYPTITMAAEIMPKYVAKVVATDADIKDTITYSVTSSNEDKFMVQFEEGTLVMRNGGVDEDETVTIEASDGQNAATIDVHVKILDDDEIASITVKDVVLEDLDNVMNDMNSQNSNFKLYSLSAAVVASASSATRAADDGTLLKIIAYGVSNSGNDIVEINAIKSFVNGLGTSYEAVKWQSGVGGGGNGGGGDGTGSSDETDTTGLIAAISVISVLFALVLIGGIAIYWFKLRPKNKYARDAKKNDDLDENWPVTENKNLEQEKTIATFEDTTNNRPSKSKFSKNNSKKSKENRINSSSDLNLRRPTGTGLDQQTADVFANGTSYTEPTAEPRKSLTVTFGKEVEVIPIETSSTNSAEERTNL